MLPSFAQKRISVLPNLRVMPAFAGCLKMVALEKCTKSTEGMLNTLAEGFGCISGTWSERASGVWAGWVSGETSAMPCVWNAAGSVGLILTGEVFCEGDGEACSETGNQDMIGFLLRGFEKNGLNFLEQLNGWFGGLLLDLRKHEFVLFNDRYGLGRIYYHEGAEGFWFASEAKALLNVLPHTRQLNDQGVAEWLTCGCVLQNRTLFTGIMSLPPGSAWVFSAGGKVARQRYFAPSTWESQPKLSPTEYYQQLKETFPRVLKRYFAGTQKVAMSLTGGLDGRMIMSWLPCGPGELPCYTFNGPIRDCADVRIVRRVARVCGQSHHTIPVDGQFFDQFPTLAEKCVGATDGTMDVTGAVELYANQLARQFGPVRLTGNYGSEILRSNVAFKPRHLRPQLFTPGVLRASSEAVETYAREAAGNRLSFIAFKQVPWHHFSRFAAERSKIMVRSPYLDNELVALAFRAPPELATSAEPALRLISEGNPELGRIPTDRGLIYRTNGTANRVHHSLEEMLAKAEYAYDYGMPNWLARVDRCFAPLRLERLFLGRQKFCHFRTWYRHQLASYVQQVLLESRARNRGYVEGAALEAMLAAHVRGSGNYTLEIHKLLSLELTQRLLLERS
jgi:asparagine synthase (glutamine-hydrolysing)